MKIHKTISSATASRDLKQAVDLKILEKAGDKNETQYKFKSNWIEQIAKRI